MVAARFNANIGYRICYSQQCNGKPLPFRALASNDETGQQSIVDEGSSSISLGYRVNHKAGLYAGEIGRSTMSVCFFVHRIQNPQPLYYKARRSAIKDKKMKRAPLITGLLLISTSCAYASSGGCGADSTSGTTNYSSVVDDVTVNQTDNVTDREFTSATLSSTNWQYACSCSAVKAVKLVYMVSPVLTTTGHQTGYYKLNDSLDIKTTLQANDRQDSQPTRLSLLTPDSHR